MAGLLVPVVFVLGCLAAIVGRDRLGFGHTLREAVLASGTACGGFVWATVELLGVFDGLRKWPVLLCWAAAAVALGVYVWRNRDRLVGRWPSIRWPGLVTAFYATVSGVVLTWTGLTAALVPTTNIDALVYHLPRQLQWVQNGNVAHFPTQDYRLTVSPPFAEFAGVTFWTLTDGDCWSNIPQWAALGLTMVAVGLTARELGTPPVGQWLAAALVAMLPIAFQQAASPKNDLMTAWWLSSLGYWVVRVWSTPAVSAGQAVMVGLSLGLLVLTKGTGTVFASPLAALGMTALVARRPAGWAVAVALITALVPLVNLGHWKRNLTVYGSIAGETFGLATDRITPGVVASNVLRNGSVQAALPITGWKAAIEQGVATLHDVAGVPLNDPAATWLPNFGYSVAFDPASWEMATAPVHALLVLVTLGAIPLSLNQPGGRQRVIALIGATAAFVAFSAAFKWQPSNSRLLLPVEVLFAAPVAFVVARPGLHWLGVAGVAGALVVLLPIASKNAADLPGLGRPWAERWSPEARYGPFEKIAFVGRITAGRIRQLQPASIGIVNNTVSGWEYPVCRTVQQWATAAPRFGYFYPTPELHDPGFTPDAVIDVGTVDSPAVVRHPDSGRWYHVVNRIGIFTVYLPLKPGEEAIGTGYRLTAAGGWEPVGDPQPSGPPTGLQPITRFGVRVERPDSPGHAPHERPLTR
jgi:hypothetical protein